MNCYVCALRDHRTAASSFCRDCHAALCTIHAANVRYGPARCSHSAAVLHAVFAGHRGR